MVSLVNLTNLCSQSSGEMKIIFVRDDDSQANFDNIIQELKGIQSNVIDVIEPEDCFEVDEHELANKKYIFVFDKFDTPSFNHISEIRHVYILGVKVILSVIYENIEVHESSFHIHNFAMKDLVLCFASIGDPEKKSRLKKLIGYMGGHVTNSLRDDVTHLVTEDLFSKKYQHAGSNGKVKIMHPKWIEDVWRFSQDFNFKRKSNDSEFIKKYQLSIFYKLIFSSTGLDNDEKKNIVKVIEDNGGEYSHIYKTSTVKILIMRAKDLGSIKHKASVKHGIHCVDPKWVFDSAEAGYALNMEGYIVKKEGQIKSSTPTKNTSALGRFNFDNTILSEIGDITTKSITIDETQKSNPTSRASTNLPPQLSKVKSSSNLKASTSLRSTKSSASVASHKDETFKKPPLPTMHTKKDDKINIPSPPKFDYSEDASDESLIQILFDKIVCVYGYTNDVDIVQITSECEKLGAKLVDLSYNKIIDYVITSAEILDIELPKIKYKNLVTDLWLEESVEEGRCIEPLKFYHHSLFKPLEKHQVLKDEIFVCSNYDPGRQRPFIRQLVKALGGICKEALGRAEAPILICPTAEGKKYEGAKNWGLTVLRAEWLLKCYENRARIDEEEYLVGDTKPSRKNIKRRDSIIPSSQDLSVESESPARKPREVDDSPRTPRNNAVPDNENEAKVGNISWLLEGMPTPQRITTKEVLLEQQKKNKVSPRTKLLKDLLQTPGNAQKTSNEYAPSPIPEFPQILEKPADGNYGLVPDASPATQWYYKRKLDALDEQYVPITESRRKALKEVPITPPFSHIRHDFFKKRLSDYDSPDPRKKNDETQGLFMARISVNMSNEASKFLNFEDTEADGHTLQNNPLDSEIMKLDELMRRNNDEKNSRRISNVDVDQVFHNNKKIIDFNPKSPDTLVRWSNTQAPDVLRPFSPENNPSNSDRISLSPDNGENEPSNKENKQDESPVNLSDKSESQIEHIFAISSGNNGEEKQIIGEKIEKLGGKVADLNFTHLVMSKISKSSKFFSALASGKHVIHASYLDECLKENKFIETDCFEFGNPRFNCDIQAVKEPVLLEGPYKCRQLVRNNPEKYERGLFTDMKFILIASAEKMSQFVCVIESGGGTIIKEKPEFKVSVLKRCNVDYCLVDNLKSLTRKDMDVLNSCNIQIKNVKFIYEYLLSNNNSSM